MGKRLDLVGQVFGRLTVLKEAGRTQNKRVIWRCKCDCGNEVTVSSDNLRSGHTTSCGCFKRERSSEYNTTHGMSKTSLYHVWREMLKRTGIHKGANERVKRAYIDRGITVCEAWESFENFRDWASSNGYSEGLQIDRINNDEGYCSENCRWVTPKVNSNNRRSTIRLPDGKPLAMFCSEIGIPTVQENGKLSKQYNRINNMYTRRHKIHPELLAKANEYLTLLKRLRAVIDLLKDVREFKKQCNASQMISLQEI